METTEALEKARRSALAYQRQVVKAETYRGIRDAQVVEAKRAGASLADIAQALGLTRAAVQMILRRERP